MWLAIDRGAVLLEIVVRGENISVTVDEVIAPKLKPRTKEKSSIDCDTDFISG